MSRVKELYWEEICAMPDSPQGNEPPFDDDLAAGEQEYWETMQREIDETFIKIGRIDHILDGHTAAVNAICGTGRPKGKRSEWESIDCPF